MWHMSLSGGEFVIRGVIIYVFILFILRATGSRQVGQMTPFDLVLLLLLSNGVQNAMNGGDNTITAGLILAATLVAMNYALAWITSRSLKVERVIEGQAILLIHDGQLDHQVMERLSISPDELGEMLRQQGVSHLQEVRFGVLETNGQLSVLPFDKDDVHAPPMTAEERHQHVHALWVRNAPLKLPLKDASEKMI